MELLNDTPFRNPVIPNGLTVEHPRIREIKDTDFLVRTYDLSTNPKYSEELLRDYKEAILRWQRLCTYKSIALPSFFPVIGTLDGQNPSLFIVTERVVGENLETINLKSSKSSRAKISSTDLIISLTEYSQEVFDTRGAYLSDQNLSQYVYGKPRNGKEGVYFVDLGLEHHILPENRGHHYENSYFFAHYMCSIFTMLEQLEEKVGEPLITARLELARFLNSIDSGTGGISYAKTLLRSVQQSKFT